MSGPLVKVLTDEMITLRLADSFRLRVYDVTSCRAAGRANRGISDEDQLSFATTEGRAIYTFNATDFRRLHRQWQATGRTHAGIIISEDLNHTLSEMPRRLQAHFDTVEPALQHKRIWVLRP